MLGIPELIGNLLSLATEGLRFSTSKNATKYRDEMVDLEKQILEEEAKGYHSDDQKIVALWRRLSIVARAALDESRQSAPT